MCLTGAVRVHYDGHMEFISEDDRAAAQAEDEQAHWEQDEAYHEIQAERAAERYFEEGTEAQHMQYLHEVEQDEANAWNDPYLNEVEMGVYDDDPNPYHGDYSEM